MAYELNASTVHNEGCDLHYWHTGAGPLITFVPGGNGHGRQYFPLMDALRDRFTSVTFDRRQMSASTVRVDKRLNPAQQARDIRAVITAMGSERSIVFGSSSGGLFSFQFAHDYPEMVDHLISHEAPTFGLLPRPDSTEMMEWFLHLLAVRDEKGWEEAHGEFVTMLVGYGDAGVPRCARPEDHNARNFMENEFPVMLGWTPNLWRLREYGTSIGLMRGVRSRDAPYARATNEQEKVLGCLRWDVPGHHQGFEVELDEFLPVFLKMLEALEGTRAGKT